MHTHTHKVFANVPLFCVTEWKQEGLGGCMVFQAPLTAIWVELKARWAEGLSVQVCTGPVRSAVCPRGGGRPSPAPVQRAGGWCMIHKDLPHFSALFSIRLREITSPPICRSDDWIMRWHCGWSVKRERERLRTISPSPSYCLWLWVIWVSWKRECVCVSWFCEERMSCTLLLMLALHKCWCHSASWFTLCRWQRGWRACLLSALPWKHVCVCVFVFVRMYINKIKKTLGCVPVHWKGKSVIALQTQISSGLQSPLNCIPIIPNHQAKQFPQSENGHLHLFTEPLTE